MPTKQADKEKERILSLHESFLKGASLRQIAESQGMSYEGIRQLFIKHGLSTQRTSNSFAAGWKHHEEIWDLYKRHGTIEKVVAETGIQRDVVSHILNEMPLRQIYRRKGEGSEYEKDDLLNALREAADICGEPLTIPAYRQFAPKKKWPADLTVKRAFGSWADACKAAGVKANPAEGPRKNAYTEADCLNSLRICAAEHDGRIPSYGEYTKWAREHKQPSGPTVRVKVGPWREALRKAFS